MKIGIILLAAGNSRRFGSNKLLYLVDGQPVFLRALQQLQGVCKKNGEDLRYECELAVVTQYEEIVIKAKERGVTALVNSRPDEGISLSIKIGLDNFRDADACLFSVADQPWMSGRTIEKLVNLFVETGKGIACVSENGEPGNPCIFSRRYFPELRKLSGDRGGKCILREHLKDTVFLEISDCRELQDLDYPPELQRGKEAESKKK